MDISSNIIASSVPFTLILHSSEQRVHNMSTATVSASEVPDENDDEPPDDVNPLSQRPEEESSEANNARTNSTAGKSTCPLCMSTCRDVAALFQHLNSNHVSRHDFPPILFLKEHNRRICSTCGFAYHQRWANCRRTMGPGRPRCGGTMIDPGLSSFLQDDGAVNSGHSECHSKSLPTALQSQSASSYIPDQTSILDTPAAVTTNLVMTGLKAAADLSFQSDIVSTVGDNQSHIFNAVMEEIFALPVFTISHVPRSVRPLFAKVLSTELCHGYKSDLWGFVRLAMFAKCVLRVPQRGGRKKRYVIKSLISSRLHRWQNGELLDLWQEAVSEATSSNPSLDPASVKKSNIRRCRKLAQDGRFADAMRSLTSQGCASSNAEDALQDLYHRHPQNPLPSVSMDSSSSPPPLTITPANVITALKAFPRGTSPGATRLRAQHLLDAVTGSVAPSSQLCLEQLTRFMSSMLAGELDDRIAPWLTGAPLTALLKKKGGFRPIAVGEVLRRLASRLCCSAVRSRLPDTFIPYGQVGVGIKGGLEAAIHVSRTFIHDNQDNPDYCCLKLDMVNAFNECNRQTYFTRLEKKFPELVRWVHWSYKSAGEMRFGSHRILSTSGVQQGDPLGPLLFSLVVMELMDSVGPVDDLKLSLWYLDDGTFIGTRHAVSTLFRSVVSKGASFGLKLNLGKCEIFWPAGDQSFPNFPSEINRLQDGMELLGSPIFGSQDFYSTAIGKRVDSVLDNQSITSFRNSRPTDRITSPPQLSWFLQSKQPSTYNPLRHGRPTVETI